MLVHQFLVLLFTKSSMIAVVIWFTPSTVILFMLYVASKVWILGARCGISIGGFIVNANEVSVVTTRDVCLPSTFWYVYRSSSANQYKQSELINLKLRTTEGMNKQALTL